MKMPSWSRRFRIVIDWTLTLIFKQEPVQLGIHQDRTLASLAKNKLEEERELART